MSNRDFLPPDGPTLHRAFEALVSVLDERGVRYAIIGRRALIQHRRVLWVRQFLPVPEGE